MEEAETNVQRRIDRLVREKYQATPIMEEAERQALEEELSQARQYAQYLDREIDRFVYEHWDELEAEVAARESRRVAEEKRAPLARAAEDAAVRERELAACEPNPTIFPEDAWSSGSEDYTLDAPALRTAMHYPEPTSDDDDPVQASHGFRAFRPWINPPGMSEILGGLRYQTIRENPMRNKHRRNKTDRLMRTPGAG